MVQISPSRMRYFLLFLLLGYTTAYGSASKRPHLDYDGRPDPEPTDYRLIPRVIFFPAYLVTEYGVRRPMRWLGRSLELNNIPFLVADFFKFGEDNKYALYPSLIVDFGFRTSFGLRFRWKNFLTPGSRLVIRAATGGTDYGIAALSEELIISDSTTIALTGEVGTRPDFIFHATGPMSSRDDRYRYRLNSKKFLAEIFYHDPVELSSVRFSNEIRIMSFGNGCCEDLGIETGITNGVFGTPPRYPDGYRSFAQTLLLNWGGRVSRPKKDSGLILDGKLSHSFDFSGGGWWIYGGMVSIYDGLGMPGRVLALRVETELSNPHEGAQVPFNELPALGGNRLPGFLDRRFIDQSVFAATLEYKWPVLSLLDGVIHFSVGNVFGRNLEGLQWGWLRKSFGFGIEAIGDESSPFGMLVAFGSEPFDLGGKINEFRFSLRFGGGI